MQLQPSVVVWLLPFYKDGKYSLDKGRFFHNDDKRLYSNMQKKKNELAPFLQREQNPTQIG